MLVGKAPVTGVFDLDPKPCTLTEEELEHAKYIRPTLWGARIDADSQAVWERTMSKAGDVGWLDCPHDWEALLGRFGRDWLLCRRFGCGSATS